MKALIIRIVALAALASTLAAPAFAAEEPPSLAADVAAGKLPPVTERLPRVPLVFTAPRSDWTLGRYGGELRTLQAKDRDIRMMVVYGYSRLVGYDEQLHLTPDILEKVDNVDSRTFTFSPGPVRTGVQTCGRTSTRLIWARASSCTSAAMVARGPPSTPPPSKGPATSSCSPRRGPRCPRRLRSTCRGPSTP